MLFNVAAYEKAFPRTSEPEPEHEPKTTPVVKEEPAGDMLEAAGSGSDPSKDAEEGGADGD